MSLFLPIVSALPFALLAWHMLNVSRRSAALPDRLLAALFFAFAVGTPLRMVAADLVTAGSGYGAKVLWINSCANLVIGFGVTCLAAFTWQVFRPEKACAHRLVILFATVLGAVTLLAHANGSAAHGSSPTAVLFDAIGGLAFSWAFIECVVYQRRMQRRLALGLADPVVVNRFLLWAVWTGSIAALAAVLVGLRASLWLSGAGALLAAGGDPGGSWIALIGATKLGVAVVAQAVVVAVWLSFSPPGAYRRWLARRHGAGASTGGLASR